MSPRKAIPTIPIADLERYVLPVRRAVEVFRNRAERLRMEKFEPLGAAQEEANARDLDELARLLDPEAGG